MAVGMHAVNRSAAAPGDGAVVLGCGPVGLAVVAGLQLKGVEKILAADLSPARRRLAVAMGAAEAIDPRSESAWDAWKRLGGGPAVVFDATGAPGMFNEVLRAAPVQSRLVVVGVCMEQDTLTPFFGINKEMSIHFSLGYTPQEFTAMLRSIAEGDVDVSPMNHRPCRARRRGVGVRGTPRRRGALQDPDPAVTLAREPFARASKVRW